MLIIKHPQGVGAHQGHSLLACQIEIVLKVTDCRSSIPLLVWMNLCQIRVVRWLGWISWRSAVSSTSREDEVWLLYLEVTN